MLNEFVNGKLAINITNATKEQMRELQRLTCKKWASGHDIDKYYPYYDDGSRIYIYCSNDIDDNCCIMCFNEKDMMFSSSKIPHSRVLIDVFLDVFLNNNVANIKECDIERMFL